MSLARRVSAAVVLLSVARLAFGQTTPGTVKTDEIRIVGGDPVPTPVPVGPRTFKTDQIRIFGGDLLPTPVPVGPRTFKTDQIRLIADPPKPVKK